MVWYPEHSIPAIFLFLIQCKMNAQQKKNSLHPNLFQYFKFDYYLWTKFVTWVFFSFVSFVNEKKYNHVHKQI